MRDPWTSPPLPKDGCSVISDRLLTAPRAQRRASGCVRMWKGEEIDVLQSSRRRSSKTLGVRFDSSFHGCPAVAARRLEEAQRRYLF
eukprot:1971092-Pyramimonas_sp.AAC.1